MSSDERRSMPEELLELRWVDRYDRLRARGLAIPLNDGTKQLVVLNGSLAWSLDTESLDTSTRNLRASMLADGTFRPLPDSGVWELTRDVTCSSTSQAARLLIGQSAQGPKWWQPHFPATEGERETLLARAPEQLDRAPNESSRAAGGLPVKALTSGVSESAIQQLLADYRLQFEAFRNARDQVERDIRSALESLWDDEKGSRSLMPQVTSRLKSASSLERKARQFVDATAVALDEIKDLAGVRIVLYRDRDWGDARAAVQTLYQDPNGQHRGAYTLYREKSYVADGMPIPGQGIQREQSEDGGDLQYYRADHFQLTVTTDSGVPRRVEVQITNILDHLVNELSHDLLYKPDVGAEPDPRVQEAFRATFRYMDNARVFVQRLDELASVERLDDLVKEAAVGTPLLKIADDLEVRADVDPEWENASNRSRDLMPQLLRLLQASGEFTDDELEPPRLAAEIQRRHGSDWQRSLKLVIRGYQAAGPKPGRELREDVVMDLLLAGVLDLGKSRQALRKSGAPGRPRVIEDIAALFASAQTSSPTDLPQ